MASRHEMQSYNNLSRLVVFLILFAFWMLLSGHFDGFHLVLGGVCSAIVAMVSHDLLITNIRAKRRGLKTWRFVTYLPWLIYQVFMANFHVAYLILVPSKIQPQVVRFKPKMSSDLSMVTFANSITLTPGTITMDIVDGEFVVHALSQKVADDLLAGDMEDRVARIYLEGKYRQGA